MVVVEPEPDEPEPEEPEPEPDEPEPDAMVVVEPEPEEPEPDAMVVVEPEPDEPEPDEPEPDEPEPDAMVVVVVVAVDGTDCEAIVATVLVVGVLADWAKPDPLFEVSAVDETGVGVCVVGEVGVAVGTVGADGGGVDVVAVCGLDALLAGPLLTVTPMVRPLAEPEPVVAGVGFVRTPGTVTPSEGV